MNSNKSLALLLILTFIISGLLMAVPAKANVPKPSMPQFTVQYVDDSYTVPIIYEKSIDPFTGKEISTAHGGQHIEDKTIEVTIKNQPYTEVNINGSTVGLAYSLRLKGHFTNENYLWDDSLPASNSSYTVKSINVNEWYLENGDQIDIQVKAVMGYFIERYEHIIMTYRYLIPIEESDWSSIQTLTIGDPTASTVTPVTTAPPATATPAPTEAPTNPPQIPTATPDQTSNQLTGIAEDNEFTVAIVIAVVAAALVIIVYLRRRILVLENKAKSVEC
jgi:hypothetical protein